jgi:hypothetical protein
MLNDTTCFKQDLRFGIDTLVSLIGSQTDQSPYVPDTIAESVLY